MKKLISLVLVLMMLTALMVPVYASGATISASGATGAPGQEVTVYVSISNNPGILGGNVTLSYDKSVMTLKSMTPGLYSTVNPSTGFANGAYAVPMSENGVLVTAVFLISDSANDGSTSVSVSGSYRDASGTKQSYSTSSTVTVKAPHVCAPTLVSAVAATCEVPGNEAYYKCSCGNLWAADGTTSISAVPTIPALGHDMKETAAAVAPTCTTPGKTAVMTCTRAGCGKTTGGEAIPATGHTPGKAVKENEVPATCTTDGSYDEVVYCSVCKAELSRDTKTEAALGHTPGAAVKENEVPATCAKAGSYDEVVYCSVCKKELSRTPKTVPALSHTPGQAVKENEVPATCKVKHTWDEVIYCSICKEELQRTKMTGELGGHNYVNGKCTVCGKVKDPNLDNQPDTGDIFVEIAMYASVAALAVGAVVFAKRKARNN